MEIRIATQNDLPELTYLWQERMVILSQSDPRVRLNQSDRDVWLRRINEHIANHASTVLVAEEGRTLIGYIAGHLPATSHPGHTSRYGIVDEIALDAHAYHGGLARLLYVTLSTWFSKSDAVQIVIHTARFYAVEQAFWRGLGAKIWNPPEQEGETWETAPEYVWLTL